MNEPKAKILITTSTYPRWKNDTSPPFVHELCQSLKDSGFHVYVLAPHTKGAKTFEKIDEITIYRYKYFPEKHQTLAYEGGILSKLKTKKIRYFAQIPFFFLCQLWSLKRIIKNEEINIIHAQWLIPQGLVATIYKKLFNRKIKVLCTSHGSDILGLRSKLSIRIKKFILNNTDYVTCVSKHLDTEIHKICSNVNSRVVPMGVDINLFSSDKYDPNFRLNCDNADPILVCVGRLSEEKGVVYLIQAIPEVLKTYPKATLLIIGEGPLKKHLEMLTKELSISNNVKFLGSLSKQEIAKYYASSDILISPSLYEGFGLVLAEALASQCFVISSELSAISEIIIDNHTGFVVPRANSKAISQKIQYILNNKDSLQQIKITGRDHVTSLFDWKIIGQKYKDIILALNQ